MNSGNAYSVVIKRLSKKFGDFEAVKDINFEIKRGEIFGILGPNGAGKTTTLNMILGLLKPTGGSIIIEGNDNVEESEKVKQIIGFMTQETVVDSYLTARDNLRIFARLYHIPEHLVEQKVNHALEEANLLSFADVAAGTFSGGMQRRLNLVKSMIQEPKILILDEPTTGLDVQSRVSMWNEIKRLNREGMTIILTTQYLEEADSLCDRIAIIDHGTVKAIGTAQELKRMVSKGNILGINAAEKDEEKVSKLLKSKFGITLLHNNNRLEATIDSDMLGSMAKIAQALDKEGINVESISMHLPTMDDVFIRLTGSSFRDKAGEQQSSMNKVSKYGR